MIIKSHGGKYLVVAKKDPSKVLGTHDTHDKALAQLRAIEISKHLSGKK